MTAVLVSPTSIRQAQRRRATVVTGSLAAGVFALFVLSMMVGSYRLNPWEVITSVSGLRPDPAVDFIVRGLRLPVASTALAVGFALGVAGLVFQNLLANPLASPDFVGVSSGASLFAVGSIVLLGAGGVSISVLALVGALVSATLVYVLAWRGGLTGFRFILVGIGISELMYSLIGYMLARSDIYEARAAMTWLVGSVGLAGAGELRALLAGLVVLVPCALLLARPLRTLELGDAAARALGTRVEPTRLALIAVSIVLVGLATAAAGPVLFVALVAGPIARRLLGPASGGIVAAGLVGASVVLGADLVAQHLLPTALPTGVVTGAVGAPYLIWLLVTVNKEGRGG